MYSFLVLCILVAGAAGQISLQGECNLAAVNQVTNPNITQLFGLWNQIKRINNAMETGECSTLNVTGKYEGSTLRDVEFTLTEVVNKTQQEIHGNIVTLQDVLAFNMTNVTLPFVILSTDYTGYAILYSCISVNTSSKLVWSWQYNRKTSHSTAEQNVIDAIIANNTDLRNATWKTTSHDSSTCRNAGVDLTISHLLFIFGIIVLMSDSCRKIDFCL